MEQSAMPGEAREQAHAGLLSGLRVLALGVLVAALLGDVFTFLDLSQRYLYDFASYYVPARALLDFPAINPYDFPALTRLNAVAQYVPGRFDWFLYPPGTLLLLRPAAALPFGAASQVWAVVSHVAAVLTAVLLGDAFAHVVRRNWQAAGPGRDRMLDQAHTVLDGTSIRVGAWAFPTVPVAICATVLLFAYPTRDTYLFGQINLIVVFCLVLALHAHLHNRPALAGIAVAVAGVLKLSPLFMLAFFVVRGAWKALLWGIATSLVFVAAPLVVISPRVFGQFAYALGYVDANVVATDKHNESMAGLFVQIADLLHVSPGVGEHVAEVLGALLAVGCIGALLALALPDAKLKWRPRVSIRVSERPDLDWQAFAFLLVAYLLATPLVWSHYYVIAVPALLGLGAYPLLRRRGAQEGWTATDTLVMLGSAVALTFVGSQLPLNADALAPNTTPVGALLLRALRVIALGIAWGLAAVIVAPMVRGATWRHLRAGRRAGHGEGAQVGRTSPPAPLPRERGGR